jgi:hypothetical protein
MLALCQDLELKRLLAAEFPSPSQLPFPNGEPRTFSIDSTVPQELEDPEEEDDPPPFRRPMLIPLSPPVDTRQHNSEAKYLSIVL